uniref:Uncharacterized protein n=1 Tax=Piliocolobus tephrosceles TaxID=591936 RepID=A0A8C9GQI5_9PRIM
MEETGMDELRRPRGMWHIWCTDSGEWPMQLDVQHIITLGHVDPQHQDQKTVNIVFSVGILMPTFKTYKGMDLRFCHHQTHLAKLLKEAFNIERKNQY